MDIFLLIGSDAAAIWPPCLIAIAICSGSSIVVYFLIAAAALVPVVLTFVSSDPQ